jgi:hypothetical protein
VTRTLVDAVNVRIDRTVAVVLELLFGLPEIAGLGPFRFTICEFIGT